MRHRPYAGPALIQDTYSMGRAGTRNLPRGGDPAMTASKVSGRDRFGRQVNLFSAHNQPGAPGPLYIHGVRQYRVSKIRNSAALPDGEGRSRLYYQVSWTGWRESDDDYFYPASNFRNCPVKLEEYHAVFPNSPGPPLRLPTWHRHYCQGNDYSHQDDDNIDSVASVLPGGDVPTILNTVERQDPDAETGNVTALASSSRPGGRFAVLEEEEA